jgi:hypothetical protein
MPKITREVVRPAFRSLIMRTVFGDYFDGLLPPPPPSLPLDNFTTVSRAYSVARRLRTAYTGPLFRVRRSSDNTEQDIGYTANNEVDGTALLNFVGGPNVLLWSEVFSNAVWAASIFNVSIVDNVAADSTGALTADRLTATSNLTSGIGQNVTTAAGDHTFSVEVLAESSPFIRLFITDGGVVTNAYFNLTNNTAGTVDGLLTAAIEPLTGGWVRLSITRTLAAGTTGFGIRLASNNNVTASVSGHSVVVARAQVAQASTPQLYGRTTTAAVSAGDGFVAMLYDQSVPAVNLANTTGTQQPGIVTAGVINLMNGRPAMIFNGTSHHLFSTTPGLYAAGSTTVVMALRGNAAINSFLFSESSSSSATPIYAPMATSSTTATTASAVLRNDGNALILNAINPLAPLAYNNTPRILTSRDTGSQVEMFLDGSPANSTSYTRSGTLTVDRQTLGALVRSTVGNFWAGNVSELVAFNSALSTGDRQTYERNLGSFTGITVA